MRNRAKCKLCGNVIESFHRHDYVTCPCGEIAVDGGMDYFRAMAHDWANFIRIDDDDNEMPVQVKDKLSQGIEETVLKPVEDIFPQSVTPSLDQLDYFIKTLEELNPNILNMNLTNEDLLGFSLLMRRCLLEVMRTSSSTDQSD